MRVSGHYFRICFRTASAFALLPRPLQHPNAAPHHRRMERLPLLFQLEAVGLQRFDGFGHLVAPRDFSKVRSPPMPSIPVMTTHNRSIFSTGGSGHPLMLLYQAIIGWSITE